MAKRVKMVGPASAGNVGNTGPKTYQVGYGKPPKHTQFKPGQSGNPKGRKQQPKSVSDELWKAMLQPVTVNEGGRKRKVTKLALFCTQLVNRAAKGDMTAIRVLAQITGRSTDIRPGPNGTDVRDQDIALIEELFGKRQ